MRAEDEIEELGAQIRRLPLLVVDMELGISSSEMIRLLFIGLDDGGIFEKGGDDRCEVSRPGTYVQKIGCALELGDDLSR